MSYLSSFNSYALKYFIFSVVSLFFAHQASSQCCDITLEMNDDFGDGWNGGYLTITINGSTSTHSASGYGSTVNFSVCDGDSFQVFYTSGTWEGENSYSFSNSEGIVFSAGPNPPSGAVYSSSQICSEESYEPNDFCETSNPFCTDSPETFPAGVNSGSAQFGADYTCLFTQPNPAWYYLEISTGGNIIMDISPAPAVDIDFALWGPFGDETTPCVAALNAANTVDCSYDPQSAETAVIPNAQPGETYIMLITNFSNNPTNITLSQSGGTGATDCSIIEPCDPPTVTTTEVMCFGENNGSATVTPDGDGPFDYTLVDSDASVVAVADNAISPFTFNNLAPGEYEVVVINEDDCENSETFTITEPSDLVLNVSTTSVSCSGLCDGSATMTVSGGISPYTFNLGSGPQVSEVFENLCADDYAIVVTDENGCSISEQIEINQPTPPNPGLDDNITVCENGATFNLFTQLGGTPDPGGQWYDIDENPVSDTVDPSVVSSGTYTYVLGSPGCTYSATIDVIINPVISHTEEFTICENEYITLPDGTTVNTAGSYDVTLQSVVTGCDSIITTNVTVNPLLTSVQDFTICEDESVTLPDGTTVNTAGSYDVTLQSVVTGCDSTITTNVTVNPLLTSVQDFTICEDESVTLPDGTDINTAGSYDVTLQSVVTGCDSTITTNVTVNPLLTSVQDFTICEDESVTLPDGTTVNTDGSYDVTLQSVVTGCDSTITTNVTVNPLLTSVQDFTICEDESVTLPDGTTVNTAGSYDVTLQSVVTGCDSTITTNVTVNPLLTSVQDFTICLDESLTLPDGTTVNTSGSYDVTLQSVVTGCDSTITTNLTVNPLLTSVQDFTICEDESVTLPDGTTVDTAGSYDVTLQSVMTGCDSTITTNVTVNPLLTSVQDFTICEDESVMLPDGTTVNVAGSYDVTLQSVVTGCDSTITSNVAVNPLLTSVQNFTICEDESVTLPDGTTVNTAGSYDVTLQSVVTGCDSTVSTNVSVVGLIGVENVSEECSASGNTYTVSFEISGGDPDSYSVTGIDGTVVPGVPYTFISDPISEGTPYDILVSDENSCNPISLSGSVSCSCPATASLTGDNTICEGEETTLTFSFAGNGPFSATYTDGLTEFELSNVSDSHTVVVSPGINTTYTMVGMSDSNCNGTISGSATVTVNTIPSAGEDSEISLCNTADPVSLISELGGNPDLNGTWVDPNGDPFTNPLDPETHAAGTYTYTVTGSVPCPNASAEISVELLSTVSVNNIVESCAGDGATYTVSFEISGGDADTYNISGIAGTLTPGIPSTFVSEPIVSGNDYSISVSDVNACNIIELSGTVACDCPVSAEISGSGDICFGASANLTFDLEGDGPFDVVFTDGDDNFTLNGISDGHTVSVSPDESSTYTLVSVQNSICPGTISGTVEIEVTFPPDAGEDAPLVVCANGTEQSLFELLDGTPNTEGIWTDLNGNNFNGILDPATDEPGTYTYTVSGGTCPDDEAEVEVQILTLPNAEILGNASICDGNLANLEVDLEGSGNWIITYAINGVEQPPVETSDPEFEIATGEEGTYTIVSVEDDFCTGTTSGSGIVSINDSPTANISGQGAICPNGEAQLDIDLTGEGPWSVVYTIDGDVQDPLEITDPNFELNTNETGIYEIQSVSDANCPGTPSGSAEVEYLPYPEATISGGGVICPGENAEIQIEFTGSGNWEFVIAVNGETGPAQSTDTTPYIFSSEQVGAYELVSVEDDLCIGTTEGEAEIDLNDVPSATISGEGAICDGQATTLLLELTGEGPWTVGYAIDGAQQPPLQVNDSLFNLTSETPGDYTLLSVSDQHCIGTVDGAASVTEYPLPTAHISGNALICPTDGVVFNIVLSGTAPWTVVYSIDGVDQPPLEINSSPFELEASEDGTYLVESVQDIHCSNFGTGTAELEYASYPTATLSGGGTFCPGDMGNVAILLTGEGPWTFEYAIDGVLHGPITTSSNTYTLFDDITGTYSLVSVSDASCGGTVEGEATVVFSETPQVAISPGGSVCPGESFELWAEGSGGVPPYTYQWFNVNDDNWVQFDDSVNIGVHGTSGIYAVATDQCGSAAISDTSWVSPHLVPLASFHFDPRHDLTVQYTTINYTSETSLHAYSLYWEFYELSDHHGWQLIGNSFADNPTFTYPDEPGQYQACLYVETEEGCVNEVCLPLEIAGEFIFYMPNAFTPNEDGINDMYGPVMEGIDPGSYEFLIVNRWGETVFYSNDINQKWNGSGLDGTHYAPNGVYSWRVKVRQQNATDAEEYRGHVTVVR